MKLKRLALLLFVALGIFSCNPNEVTGALDKFQLTLNSNIFNYRRTLQFTDENGQPIQGLEILVEGRDANKIYTELGTTQFFVNNGSITLAVHPQMEPLAEGDTVKFSVYASAPGKESGSFDVAIPYGIMESSVTIGLYDLNNMPDFVSREAYSLAAVNGEITQQTTITGKRGGGNRVIVAKTSTLDSIYYDDDSLSVIVLPGAKFFYWEEYSYPYRPKTFSSSWDTIKTVINGTLLSLPVEKKTVVYGDTILRTGVRKVNYTGSVVDVEVITNNYNYPPYRYFYGNLGRSVKTLLEGTVAQKRLYLDRLSVKNLQKIRYLGKDGEGNKVELHLSRSRRKSIMFSSVIDPSTINPLTGSPVQAGDTLETGYRWSRANGEYRTTREEVVLAPNGDLRIQSEYPHAGVYRNMPYDFSWDYDIDLSPPTNVPDVSNIVVDAYLYPFAGSNSSLWILWNFNLINRSYSLNQTGGIISLDPISGNPRVEIRTRYWDKVNQRETYTGSALQIDAIKESDFSSLPSVTEFDLEVVCAANDSVRIRPTIIAPAKIRGARAYFRLINGSWATRAIELGDSMDLNIRYKNWEYDTVLTVNQALNSIEVIAETNEDVCDF